MASPPAMHTFAARLASFEAAAKPNKGKKRTSSAKGKKVASGWQLESPNAEQLAQAGFYSSPTTSSLDNVTCFQCHSSLDEWEEGDDAFREHLQFAPNCSWAVTQAIEQGIIEQDDTHDPCHEDYIEVRKDTFAASWPHEDKRGWVCKIQKLAEAGWYYYPTPESDDQTKCAYCCLSLDGWEPKDKPLEEHKKRSPGCAFFALSERHKRGGRGMKGRLSKASRVSTLTNVAPTQGESTIGDEPDLNDSILSAATDVTTASIATTGMKKGKPAKKSTIKTTSRATRGKKKEEPREEAPEPEDDDFEVKVASPAAAAKSTRGKKRSSAQVQVDSGELEDELAPAPKRRATRARESTAKPDSMVEQTQVADASVMEIEPEPISIPKGAKASRTRSSTASRTASRTASSTRKASGRKASATSAAPEAPLQARLPDDGEIEAMLEADLDRPLSDEEVSELVAEEPHKPKRQPRGKAAAKKAAPKSVSRTASKATKVTEDSLSHKYATVPTEQTVVEATKQEVEEPMVEPSEAAHKLFANHYEHLNDDENRSANESEASVMKKSAAKKATRKASTAAGKGRKPTKKAASVVEKPQPDPETELVLKAAPEPEPEQVDLKSELTQNSATIEARDEPTELRFSSSFEEDTSMLETAHVPDEVVEHFSPKKPAPQVEPAKVLNVTKSSRIAKQPAKKGKSKKAPIQTDDQMLVDQEPEPAPTHEDESEQQIRPQPSPISVEGPVSFPSPSPARSATHRLPPPTPHSAAPSHPGAFPSPTPSLQSSDAENAPPSSRPSAARPPLALLTPSQPKASMNFGNEVTTPTRSVARDSSGGDATVSPQWALQSSYPWRAVDIERVFLPSSETQRTLLRAKWFGTAADQKENSHSPADGEASLATKLGVPGSERKDKVRAMAGLLSSPEKRMTVEQWIRQNAIKGEERLKEECERVVGRFENEGVRALKALEGLVVDE